jgi:UDP-glucuronate 4-epimerase
VVRLIDLPPRGDPAWSGDVPDPSSSRAPWRVYNIGNNRAIEVTELVRLIEQALGKSAIRELAPMQPGDVRETRADVADLGAAVGFAPKTPIEQGIERFVRWYQEYRQRGELGH